MCVAIPGEILSVEPNGTAVVDFGGTRRTVCISLLDRGEVGDFVIVHAGFALHRVAPEEARQTIELFRSTLDDDTF